MPLPEIILALPLVVPPIVLPLKAPFIRTPYEVFPKAAVPAAFRPIMLPHTVLLLLVITTPLPLPEIKLRSSGFAPPIIFPVPAPIDTP